MEILILKAILISFLITQFEPIQWVLELFPNNLFTAIVTTLLTCLKCCSFWAGLIIGGFWIGCMAFAIGWIIDKILMRSNVVKLK